MTRATLKLTFLLYLFLTGSRFLSAAEPWQVMTWNVRYNTASDGVNAWPKRKDWVAEIVKASDVDVAGFQEVKADQWEDLRSRLPDMAAYGVGRDDGKEAGEFVPIFVRSKRFEIIERGTFWLSSTPDQVGSKGWDAALPRIASWVQVRDRGSSQLHYVVNVHLDHQGGEARTKSAELLRERIGKQFAAHPVILLGDFNTLPDSEPYRILTSAPENSDPVLFDAYKHAAAKPIGPDSTWNGFKKIVPQQRIDFVFATKSIAIQRLETLADQKDDRFPSDHLPVVVQLELAE